MKKNNKFLAEREILIRLIDSLKNESSPDLLLKSYADSISSNALCIKNPKTKSLIIISKDYKTKKDNFILEVDEQGNFRDISYKSFLDDILDIWNITDIEARKRVHKEIMNSYENMSHIFKWERKNLSQIKNRFKKVLQSSSIYEVEEAFRISESIPFKGHPLHPCTKTKFGISKKDIPKFAPEYFPKVPLRLLAIKKDFIKELGEVDAWSMYLKNNTTVDYNEKTEVIYPVHPWHFENFIKETYRNDFENGTLRLLNNDIVSYPTLSFRTLALPIDEKKQTGIHVKLPIGIQATSVFRLLSKRDIYNGIIFSKAITPILPKLKAITSKKAVIVSDKYGSHFITERGEYPQGPLLSFMFRENPIKYISKGDKLLVASSLTHLTERIGKPLLFRFQEKSGIDSISFFRSLFHTLLYLPIELFVKYGIALDPHGQNCILVFDNNFHAKSMIYRDLGSIQIVKDSLLSSLDNLVDYDKTVISYSDCTDELIHSIYYNLLADFVDCIYKSYSITPNFTWNIIKEVSLEILENINCDNKNKERFEKLLLGDFLPIKALLRMRLRKNKTIFNNTLSPLKNIENR